VVWERWARLAWHRERHLRIEWRLLMQTFCEVQLFIQVEVLPLVDRLGQETVFRQAEAVAVEDQEQELLQFLPT
jgi:hypothetical protein